MAPVDESKRSVVSRLKTVFHPDRAPLPKLSEIVQYILGYTVGTGADGKAYNVRIIERLPKEGFQCRQRSICIRKRLKIAEKFLCLVTLAEKPLCTPDLL
jgi:hypothetical protein